MLIHIGAPVDGRQVVIYGLDGVRACSVPWPLPLSRGRGKGRPGGLGLVQLSVGLHTVALGFRCIVCAFLFNLSVI